jgi:hypothetical protein
MMALLRPARSVIPVRLCSLGLLALLAACQAMPMSRSNSGNAAASADALIPDYTPALQSNPNDYIPFLKAWFRNAPAEIDSPQIVRFNFPADDKTADLAAEKLIDGNEAFCTQNGGKMTPEPGGLSCAGPAGKLVSRLSVQVFHATADQPGALQFTGESAAWMARLNEQRLTDYRRVIDALSGNGVAGNVLLSTGESFIVVRFGRLSATDFYALKTPAHGLVFLSDVVSVKWVPDGMSVVERDGDRYTETAEGLTPGNTLVRLQPTVDNQLQAIPLSFEDPFRFVYLDPKSKQPRQARVRADTRILQINIAAKPSKYRAGSIATRFDKKDRENFRKSLVADARKTSATVGKKTDSIDLNDAEIRADLEQVGRGGPCARSQFEDRVRAGDITYSEYLVCAEYRQEADAAKATGGELSPDKTPLLFMGRAARAPWYDFNGVLH